MTLQDAVTIVRELRGLTRLDHSIARLTLDPSSAPEWRFARTAIADRLKWLQYGASCAGPELLARAEAVLVAEGPDPVFTSKDWTAAWTNPH